MATTCTRRHVVVTGASSGIGRAAALRLAADGWHVYAGVRKPADGEAVRQSGPAGAITPLLLDVTDAAQIAAAVDAVSAHVAGSGLDGLVNNAGIGVFGPLELIPLADFRQLLEANVTGQLAVTQAFLPALRLARGRIVLIGSIGARFTPPFVGPLAASKSALATLGEALRQELMPWGVRVALVEPASIHSDAVGKLDRDAERLLSRADPGRRALYEESFGRMLRSFAARHRAGSPPETAARTIAHALTSSRPQAHYLVGKGSRQMALLGATLPTRAADRLRRRIADQPAAGAAIAVSEPARTATPRR